MINNLKKSIRLFLWRILGTKDYTAEIKSLRDEVNTLRFFLNTLHDVSKIPPTSDSDLRIMQLCDVQLLRIIDKLCKKHKLQYWLDYGTLLGAYRHGGFIPWDDDTDLTMPRKDYDVFISTVGPDLESIGIEIEEREGRIGIGYKHKETGIWADIFPADDYYSDKEHNVVVKELKPKFDLYWSEFSANFVKESAEWLSILRNRFIGKSDSQSGKLHYIYHCPRMDNDNNYVCLAEYVFPSSQIQFENYTFSAPYDVKTYLAHLYGANYMSFPKKGVLHHSSGRLPLSTWAKHSNTDMSIICAALKDIADKI